MAGENSSQTVETSSGNGESVAKELSKMEGQETAEGHHHESTTKGMLREAIQKVMKEIEHHEREAKRHLQQAKALRKDLRDSFAFLQERKDDEPSDVARETSEEAEGEATDVARVSKPQPGKSKKKQSASKKKVGPKG